MDYTNVLNLVIQVLVVAGALNWGLVGLLNLNVVEMLGELVGAKEVVSRVVYVLVGVAGVLQLVNLVRPGLLG